VPFLYFNRTSSLVAADATVVDSTRGFGEAVDRAVELGHRRIAAVAGPSNTSTGVSREAALRKALAKHGLSLEDRLLLRGPFDDKTGDAAMTELLALAEPPTLVFCGNDVVAYGALNAARRAGVSVPTDISVIGFDDLPAASWAIIDLSTIAYDYPAMVESAARLIVDRVEQPDSDFAQIEFDTRFVERSSLAAAR
jgi:LacI family transcriptional regulator